MKKYDTDSLVINIKEDIKNAKSGDIDKIYKAFKGALEQFDRDTNVKNLFDFFKGFFKSRREKCILFINDLMDSKDKLTDKEKESLRKELLDISNIHRTLLENLQSLFGAL
jgi:hypothetical protein